LKRFWTITLGAPWEDSRFSVLNMPKPEGRTLDGEPRYSNERAVFLWKMWRDRWYFAEPFEAPEWRGQWVEWMEP